MKLVKDHAEQGTVQPTCDALGVSRATYYRRKQPRKPPKQRCSHRRIPDADRRHILAVLCSEEFADLSPYQVHAILLERGQYLCSIRTMYRILKEHRAVRERRNQLRHPKHIKPQLEATRPNQVWTWDISKLPGPVRGVVFSLYVVLDLFSRYVVSWTVEERESTAAAKRLIAHAVETQAVDAEALTIHADRGAPMTSTGLYCLFESLGVTGSHSRPRISNDNPFSEAHFKTIKYHHRYPKRFESMAHAEDYFGSFFDWYNSKHHHLGLGLFTPAQIHDGSYRVVQQTRQAALDDAYHRHPERFVKGPPKAPAPPSSVAINPDPPPLMEKTASRLMQTAAT